MGTASGLGRTVPVDGRLRTQGWVQEGVPNAAWLVPPGRGPARQANASERLLTSTFAVRRTTASLDFLQGGNDETPPGHQGQSLL